VKLLCLKEVEHGNSAEIGVFSARFYIEIFQFFNGEQAAE